MRIAVEDGLSVGWTIHSFKAGELSACFVVKGAYRLEHGKPAVPEVEPVPLSGDLYADDDRARSLRYPTDFVPFKPRADVLVHATAHAPRKRPVPRLTVRLAVGRIEKTLTVFGPRVWRDGILGGSRFTEAEPFVSAPIRYEEAFGGPSSRKNPVGLGVDSEQLPLIEDPRRLAARQSDDLDPAGFGPLSPIWSPRADVVGKYDPQWLKERWPWFPESFDYDYFNAAPRDQQVEGYLRGDEPLIFRNLHKDHETYRSALPGRRARCFLETCDSDGPAQYREVPVKLDTLWLDLDAERMILVWRGSVPVRSTRLKEVEKVLAWTEAVSEPPRRVSYCTTFLAERQVAEDAEFGVGSPADEAAEEAEAEAEDAAFEEAFAGFDREMEEAQKEIADAEALMGPLAPEVDAGADAIPASAALLAAIESLEAADPERARALREDLAELRRLESEFDEMESEFSAEFPPDLAPADIVAGRARGEAFVDADLSEMDLSGQDLSGTDFRDSFFYKAVLKGTILRSSNLAGCDLSGADLSGADLTRAILDGATLTGARLTGATLEGLSLEKADLSGLDLQGCDFSGSSGAGADFSGAYLTGARFVGVRLPGADFSGATLQKADFRDAELPQADFEEASAAGIILAGADLTGLRASEGADFSGGDFRRVKAAGAVFGEAILDRGDFGRAILIRAQFPGASLRGANFDRANVSNASFDGADLRKASLTNANLIRALFDEADLTEASLAGSNLFEAGLWEAVMKRVDLRGANVKGTTLA